jgi:hypothetical protein
MAALPAPLAHRLRRAVPRDMVRREEAIEADAGQVRRQVLANLQCRQLSLLSMAALPPADVNPRTYATRRDCSSIHTTEGASTREGASAAS